MIVVDVRGTDVDCDGRLMDDCGGWLTAITVDDCEG
jgi:hypothetical protein